MDDTPAGPSRTVAEARLCLSASVRVALLNTDLTVSLELTSMMLHPLEKVAQEHDRLPLA